MFENNNYTKTELKVIEDLVDLETYVEQVNNIDNALVKNLLSNLQDPQFFLLQVFHYANRFSKIYSNSLFTEALKIKNKRNESFTNLKEKQSQLSKLNDLFLNYVSTYGLINEYIKEKKDNKKELNILKEDLVCSYNEIVKLVKSYTKKYLSCETDLQK